MVYRSLVYKNDGPLVTKQISHSLVESSGSQEKEIAQNSMVDTESQNSLTVFWLAKRWPADASVKNASQRVKNVALIK